LCHSRFGVNFLKMPWRQRLVMLAMAVYLACRLFPSMAEVVGAGIGFSLPLFYLLAFLLIVVVVPVVTVWLFSFAYAVVLRPYVRAWHINRIRNARYFREAMERGSSDSREQTEDSPE
jgi:uncharacterized membrane protein (DUF106 family)